MLPWRHQRNNKPTSFQSYQVETTGYGLSIKTVARIVSHWVFAGTCAMTDPHGVSQASLKESTRPSKRGTTIQERPALHKRNKRTKSVQKQCIDHSRPNGTNAEGICCTPPNRCPSIPRAKAGNPTRLGPPCALLQPRLKVCTPTESEPDKDNRTAKGQSFKSSLTWPLGLVVWRLG